MTQQLNQDFMIQIKDMNKWYGEFHVLKNINLNVKKANVSSFVGHLAQENRP